MKNKILKGITGIMAIVFVVSVCLLDSERIEIPLIAIAVSMIWLFLFGLANRERMCG